MKTFIYSALIASALAAQLDGTETAAKAADTANIAAKDKAIAETTAGTTDIPPATAMDATKEGEVPDTKTAPTEPLECGDATHWKEELELMGKRYFWGWVCYKDLEQMIHFDPNPERDPNFDWQSVDWEAIPWDLHWRIKSIWKNKFKETWENEWASGSWVRRCVKTDEFRELITDVQAKNPDGAYVDAGYKTNEATGKDYIEYVDANDERVGWLLTNGCKNEADRQARKSVDPIAYDRAYMDGQRAVWPDMELDRDQAFQDGVRQGIKEQKEVQR